MPVQEPGDFITSLKQKSEGQIQNNEFDPLDFLNRVRDYLSAIRENDLDNFTPPENEDGWGKYECAAEIVYRGASDFLRDKPKDRYTYAVEELLCEWWNDFGLRQYEMKKHISRAAIAFLLTELYLKLRDNGGALRWALLTQAEDILNKHKDDGCMGKRRLRTILGMTEEELSEFNQITKDNLDKVEKECKGNWSVVEGFAEDAIVRFALKKPDFAHLFMQESSVREFPLSKGYFKALLTSLDERSKKFDNQQENKTADKKVGYSMEHLASYLFLLIPGWVPYGKVKDETIRFETDIVVRNLNPTGNLTSEIFGRYFLVECKNLTKVRPGSPDIGYFLYRMHLSHTKFGVIFARKGISGDGKKCQGHEEEWYARQLIRNAFHEDGCICIVLDRDDLDKLVEQKETFWSMLLRRMETFQFGKSDLAGK